MGGSEVTYQTKTDGEGLVVMATDDLTYNKYLRIPELLELQVPQSDPPHHHEMLFIVIHQAYELWFKLILHELDQTSLFLGTGEVLSARDSVHRVVEIMRLLVQQIEILATLKPVDFLAFRDHLNPASGFQSVQFRELEFELGIRDEGYLRFFENQPRDRAALQRRLQSRPLRDQVYDMLREKGFEVPDDVSSEALAAPECKEAALTAILPIYQNPGLHLELYLLLESLVDLDDALGSWRVRHARVVERVIGHRRGTGGSVGVGYLDRTTDKRAFPMLWEVRTRLSKPSST
jgi:tryptophan 2,3-dioxygenase